MRKLFNDKFVWLAEKFFFLPVLFLRPIIDRCREKNIGRFVEKIDFLTSNRKKFPSPSADRRRQVLIDVSIIIKNNVGTGIQRVVEAILLELASEPPKDFIVRLVAAQKSKPYRYVEAFGFSLGAGSAVIVRPGDVFFGLDLSTQVLPNNIWQIIKWKISGVKIFFLLYDIIPLLSPSDFTPIGAKKFKKWIGCVLLVADEVICISLSVRDEFFAWIDRRIKIESFSLKSSVIMLGADFVKAKKPLDELIHIRKEIRKKVEVLYGRPWLLMVGTLEPRKGHLVVLNALEYLWAQKKDISLFFIGKEGWLSDELRARIINHEQYEVKLHWVADASDLELEFLYKNCSGVIAASRAEGFGLPIVEALNYQCPILVRDIPVFREIAQNDALYFSVDEPAVLSGKIEELISVGIGVNDKYIAKREAMPKWRDTAYQLKEIISRD